ncbi:hypothetical protein EDB85DRAFT_499257 [Lactarius pseudohatsudake]|nr:hypothetical protein EDB85DRAFT_499257 [Lactarius pseudohatsudake]
MTTVVCLSRILHCSIVWLSTGSVGYIFKIEVSTDLNRALLLCLSESETSQKFLEARSFVMGMACRERKRRNVLHSKGMRLVLVCEVRKSYSLIGNSVLTSTRVGTGTESYRENSAVRSGMAPVRVQSKLLTK